MKKTFLQVGMVSAASVALAASVLAQAGSSGSTYDPSQSSQSSGSSSSGQMGSSSNVWSSSQLSSTGRSSQQAVRGSKLMGAEVKDSSGTRIGRIEDIIVNPTSGKIEFAVISRSGQGASSSPSGSSSGMGSQSSQGGTSSESTSTYGSSGTSATSSSKLIPIPWSLLQPSTPSTATSMTGQQEQSFTLTVDASKLDQAPSLSRGNWSEISQSGFSQRINSYFGVPDTSSTGGAESPSGTSGGSSSNPSTP